MSNPEKNRVPMFPQDHTCSICGASHNSEELSVSLDRSQVLQRLADALDQVTHFLRVKL